jgi:hypothetical protein
MIKFILQFLLRITGYSLILLILVFPLLSFRISVSLSIFPAIEVILIYYFATYYQLTEGKILVLGLFIDQFYSMILGCNSVVFILGNIFIKFIGKWFLIREYVSNFIIFCGYAMIVLFLRYLIYVSISMYPSIFEIIFQYLTTVFSYPLIRIILDKSSILFKKQN